MQDGKNPLVSVVLTVFRRTDYLEIAIKSVQSQSLTSWECIITDDADNSETINICERFADDQRIRYRVNKTTLGTPLNLQAALLEACGKYVAILNDDDVLYPHMLERLVKPLEDHPDAVVSFGNHDVMDIVGKMLIEESKSTMQMRLRNNLVAGLVPEPFGFALRGGLMVGMGSLCRKSAIEPSWFVSEIGGAYDYWLAVKLASQGGFYFEPLPVMAWRQHANSATTKSSPSEYLAAVYIYEKLCSTSLKPELANCATDMFVTALCKHAFLYLDKECKVVEARKLLCKSLVAKWRFSTFCYWLATFLPSKLCVKIIHVWRARRAFKMFPAIVVALKRP
jgi:glycosyltransferase involved in cell wall biosynthesis